MRTLIIVDDIQRTLKVLETPSGTFIHIICPKCNDHNHVEYFHVGEESWKIFCRQCCLESLLAFDHHSAKYVWRPYREYDAEGKLVHHHR